MIVRRLTLTATGSDRCDGGIHAGPSVRSASSAAAGPRLADLAGKRALGYLNWTRNRQKFHRRDVLDALVSDMQAQAPDHIAITGDLVNLALEAEFAPARTWLESVGAPDRVTVVPGNHDAYVRATRHRFAETLGDYLARRRCAGRSAPSFRFCAGAARWR